MNRTPAGRAPLVAAILVGVGAVGSSILGFLFVLWGVPILPRTLVLQDPIGFALQPRAHPITTVAMAVALAVLVGATWLFVRLVVRGAAAGRGGAVFLGTWGSVAIASWIVGIARAPLTVIAWGVPSYQTEILMAQASQVIAASAAWGLTWGWIVALVVTLMHRAAPAGTRDAAAAYAHRPEGGTTGAYPYPPQQGATYPPRPE